MDIAVLIDWITDNWKLIAAAVPVLGAAVTSLIGKLGKAWPIFVEFIQAIKDKTASDREIATLVWMLIAVLWGLWFKPSRRILDYMPDHQVANLKAKQFIEAGYRPGVKADSYAVPKEI